MAVKIGSARIDEHGNAKGGAAGDQTGKEISTQNWYLHKKGWRVFRPRNPIAAELIAQNMQYACDNSKIGYDQNQRLTLYNVSKPLGFSCKKVTTACETDCSALVRVCCAYAGITVANFTTSNEASALMKTGAFVELTDSKYTTSSAYLKRGDILVTKTQGHTVVVLSSGPKAESTIQPTGLRKGDTGAAVKAMQGLLLRWDTRCLPKYGADGDFGGETEAAVKAFQSAAGLPVSGVYDTVTTTALLLRTGRTVRVTGGTINVRSGPGTKYPVMGTAKLGAELPYQQRWETIDGTLWYLVEYTMPGDATASNAWVSSKYTQIVE